MKKHNIFFSALVVVLVLCMMVIPVSAADIENPDGLLGNAPDTQTTEDSTENGEDSSKTEAEATLYESLFGFDIANGSFAQLDVSSFYQMAEGFDMGAFNQLKYEIPSVEADAALLNAQYMGLLENMQASGYGTQYTITIPEFSVGYSSDIKANFQEVYGEVTSIGGFTMADVMNSTEESRHQRLKSFVGSDTYDVIYNNVSLGRIMQTEDNHYLTDALENNGSLLEGSLQGKFPTIKDVAYNAIGGGTGSTNKGSNNTSKQPDGYLDSNGIDAFIQNAKNQYITTSPEELEDQFESNKGDVMQWVDTEHNKNASEVEGWYYKQQEANALKKEAEAILASLNISSSLASTYRNKIYNKAQAGDIDGLNALIGELEAMHDAQVEQQAQAVTETRPPNSYCGGVGGWSGSQTGPYYGHYSYTNP